MKAVARIIVIICLISILIVPFEGSASAETPKAPAEQVAFSTEKKDYEAFDLGELYVKGDKLPGVKEMTQVSEFTAEQIEATHSRTVAEALQFVPGVIVSTGRKNEPSVRIRGLKQDKTLVLIDGVPYYETNYGSLDLNSIPVDNIARIEVEKGVSSVLYGPNAIAGVINIITKKPTDRPSLNARAEIGDYESRRYGVSHGMKVGKLNYWLGYEHLERDGWYLSRSFDARPTLVRRHNSLGGNFTAVLENGGVRENADEKTDAFWAKVGIDPTPTSEYYVNFHYISREKGGPASLLDDANRVQPTFSQLWRFPRYDNWGIDLSGQQKVGDRVTFKGKLFYHDHVDDLESFATPEYVDPYARSRYKDNMLGGSLLSDIKLAEIDTLRLAYHYRRDEHQDRAFENDPFQKAVSYTGSLGIENELRPVKNLSVVTGLGYDWFNVTKSPLVNRRTPYDDNLSPMAGVAYTFSDSTRLFGSWARKIRFPTLSSLYSSSSGNPDLKPEKSHNYVLGVSRGITPYANAELSLFHYDITDLITRDTPVAGSPYVNYGKVRIYGFEVAGEIFPARNVNLRLAYTYLDARDRSSGRVTHRVTGIPEHKIDATAGFLIPDIDVRLDFTGLYVSKMWGQLPTPSPQYVNTPALRTSDYFILDARISKVFLNKLEVYFVARNIFDKDYESEVGFPAPGRNLFAGVKFSY
jgi:iron complex outermembrane recepter protein